MTHECVHESEFINIRDEFKEIKDNHKILQETAKTHIEKAHFFWMMGIFIAIASSVLINFDTKLTAINKEHTERINQLEAKTNDNAVITARIETQLSQIQLDLKEIKLALKEHSL